MITEKDLIEVFKGYDDPELGIDVWTLGLIYKVEILSDEHIKILLTFTSPMCPYGPEMVSELKKRIQAKGVKIVDIEITFEPAWEPSEELKEMLGLV